MTILVLVALLEQRMIDFPYRRLKVIEACGLFERLLVHVRAFVDFDHHGVPDVAHRGESVCVGAIECDRIARVPEDVRNERERRGGWL